MRSRRADTLTDEIRRLYLEERLSIPQVSERLNLGKSCVSYRLREWGITRTPAQANETRLPLNEIRRLYVGERKSASEIAPILGVSKRTLTTHIAKMGITRSLSEATSLSYQIGRHPRQLGADNHNWKGGRWHGAKGYAFVWAPGHPKAHGNYVYEHVIVWEKSHGTILPDGYVIHHLNGVRDDNRSENLVALLRKGHARLSTQLIRELRNQIRKLENEIKAIRNQGNLFNTQGAISAPSAVLVG